MINKLELLGESFIIQSYNEGDFVNLCHADDKFSSVRVDFKKKEVSTWGKETKKWRNFVKGININDLEKDLAALGI